MPEISAGQPSSFDDDLYCLSKYAGAAILVAGLLGYAHELGFFSFIGLKYTSQLTVGDHFGGTAIDGQFRRDAWRIVKAGDDQAQPNGHERPAANSVPPIYTKFVVQSESEKRLG